MGQVCSIAIVLLFVATSTAKSTNHREPTTPRFSIVVCSAHIFNHTTSSSSDVQKVFDNHRQYATRHNYTYIVQTVPLVDEQGNIVGKYWTKVNLIKRLLRPPNTFDWVFWLDSDAIVINMSQSIESLLFNPENQIALSPYYRSTRSSSSSSPTAPKGIFSSLMEALFPTPLPTRDSDEEKIDSRNDGKNNSSLLALQPVTSLVFSGDTNAINAGVLLFRRTPYALYIIDEIIKIGTILQRKNVTIGMGSDNAAFAIFLGGCNSTASYQHYQRCYDRVDVGYVRDQKKRNKEVWRRIIAGDRGIFAEMVDPAVLPHIAPVKQIDFQAYTTAIANFVLHFVGTKRQNKLQDLVVALKLVKQ